MTRYQELAADLRTRIAHGEWPVGSVLPSEHALAQSYSVSRGTVRNALSTLALRGMVEPTRGTGWVISSGLQAREFDKLRTFREWAESHDMRIGGLVVESRRDLPTSAEALALHVSGREDVLRVTRVRTLDDQPVMIERTVWAPWIAPLIESLPADEPSIIRVMEREGIRSTRGAHRIDAVAASSEDARLLGIARSSPILRVRREYADASGRVIEIGEDRYVGGAVSFAVTVDADA